MKYKCLVCGAIIDSPNECPVCGAGPEQIVPYNEEEEKAPVKAAAKKQYRCKVCGSIIDNPNKCPVCGAGKEKIVPLEEEPAKADKPQPKKEKKASDKPQYRCEVCGAIIDNPNECPICGAGPEWIKPL